MWIGSRGYELLLQNILKRAKYLYEQDLLDLKVDILTPIFTKGKIDLFDYLRLNDNVILYAILRWADSRDKILSDLCCKYLYRDLYKSYELKQSGPFTLDGIKEKLNKCGMCDEYYLAFDKPSNVTYDYYVEGEEEEKPSILINRKNESGSFPKYTYKLKTEDGIIKNGLEKYKSLINILNGQNARFLELVATVIYFSQEGYTREEVCEKVKMVKSDKNYTDDEISSAFDFMKDHGNGKNGGQPCRYPA